MKLTKQFLKKSFLVVITIALFAGTSGTLSLFSNIGATLSECTALGPGNICVFHSSSKRDGDNIWNPVTETLPANSLVGSHIVYIFNWVNSPLTNVTVKATLAAGTSYDSNYFLVTKQTSGGPMIDVTATYLAQAANLFNGTGLNLGTVDYGVTFNVAYGVKIDQSAMTPYGTDKTFTGSATVTSSNGLNKTDNSSIVANYTPSVTAGTVLINEVVCDPKSDWSGGTTPFLLSGRGVVDANDQYIELFIKANGLNFADGTWTMEIQPVPGSANSTQVLSLGAVNQYVGGGSTSNTQSGAYLVIGNPNPDLTCNTYVRIKQNGVIVDEVYITGGSNNVKDESKGRDPVSTDTNNDGADISTNVGTPGRANNRPVDNIFQGEEETTSNNTNPKGIEVTAGSTCGPMAQRLQSGLDSTGIVFQGQSASQNAAGAYRASLFMGTVNANLNSAADFIDFFVEYTDAGGNVRTIGYRIKGRDMVANGTCRQFDIDFSKPATTGTVKYTAKYFDGTGTTVDIDKITVAPISVNNATFPKVYEAESLRTILRTATRNASGATAVKADGADYMTYGHYIADLHTGLNSNQYTATFRMQFTNVTGTAGTPLARIEAFNNVDVKRESIIRSGNANGAFQDFTIVFPSGYQGSFEFRVYTYANADVTLDKVTISPFTGDTIRYEAENDFETWNGSAVQINGAASTMGNSGMEVASTVAGMNNGVMQVGPYVIDQVATNQYYEATFRLRSNGSNNNQEIAAYLFVRDFDSAKIYANSYVYGSSLTNNFQDYKIVFKSPNIGRMDYEIQFRDQVDVIVDYVEVKRLGTFAASLPRSQEADQSFRFIGNGNVIADAQANNGYAIEVDGTVDANKNIIFTNSQEVFNAGSYTGTVYLKRIGAAPSGNKTILIEAWDESNNRYSFVEVNESDISTADYTPFNLPAINVASPSRIYFKVHYYGSSTGNDLRIDRFEIN